MLAADKLQLQSALKQQATALKEKEFNLHHSNFMTVGTQAAVLAGLDITMFIEFNPPSESSWQEEHRYICRYLRAVYYAIIIGAFCANMIVVAQTTALSVLGAGLALRGPDGSMMTATDGFFEERKSVFKTFALGLALTVGSLLLCVWLLLEWESAIVCWLVSLYTARRIYCNYHRVAQRFDFNEADTVDFTDIFDGPAAIRAVPAAVNQVVQGAKRSLLSSHHNTKKTDAHHPQQQNQKQKQQQQYYYYGNLPKSPASVPPPSPSSWSNPLRQSQSSTSSQQQPSNSPSAAAPPAAQTRRRMFGFGGSSSSSATSASTLQPSSMQTQSSGGDPHTSSSSPPPYDDYNQHHQHHYTDSNEYDDLEEQQERRRQYNNTDSTTTNTVSSSSSSFKHRKAGSTTL